MRARDLTRTAAWTGAFLAVLSACSTLAVRERTRCEDDADCAENEACLADQCYPASNVPPEDVAMLVCEQEPGEPEFCIDFLAGDAGLRPAFGALEVDRRELSYRVFMEYREASGVALAGSVSMAVPNRLGLDVSVRGIITSPETEDGEDGGEPVEPTPLRVEWPRHAISDGIDAQRGIVLEVQPDAEAAIAAPQYALLVLPQSATDADANPCSEDGDCTGDLASCVTPYAPGDLPREQVDDAQSVPPYEPAFVCTAPRQSRFAYKLEAHRGPGSLDCHRPLEGDVVRVAPNGNIAPVGAAKVTARYPEAPDAPIDLAPLTENEENFPGGEHLPGFDPGSGKPEDCATKCPSGSRCDAEALRCVVDLAGRRASQTVSSATEDVVGAFGPVAVNTYCEEPARGFGAPVGITRALDLDLVPAPESGLPDMRLHAPAVEFSAGAPATTRLCVPDWPPAQVVSLEPGGVPVDVGIDADGESVRCCHADCLVDPAGLMSADTCFGADSTVPLTVRVRTSVDGAALMDQLGTAWEDAGCAPLRSFDGDAGAVQRVLQCAGESCDVAVSPGFEPEEREYEVTVEPPVGSVFASTRVRLSAAALVDTGELRVELDPRAQLRGRVTLDEALCEGAEVDCGVTAAVVVAERLAEGETSPLGPAVFTATTFVDPVSGEDGTYVLPLDPGRYLITALPGRRDRGGPSDIEIIIVAPTEVRDRNFVLRQGEIVRVSLLDFAQSATTLPVDLASWVGMKDPKTGDVLDLNDPATCVPADRACRIRNLTMASALPVDRVGGVRFVARSRR